MPGQSDVYRVIAGLGYVSFHEDRLHQLASMVVTLAPLLGQNGMAWDGSLDIPGSQKVAHSAGVTTPL